MADDPKEGATPPAGDVKPIDDRMAAVEAEQKEQGGKIDQILHTLKGMTGPKAGTTMSSSGAGDASASSSSGTASSPDMADQMRQAVRDVHAEREQAAAKAEHDAQHAAAEQPPRTERTGKQRFQEIMFGKEPR